MKKISPEQLFIYKGLFSGSPLAVPQRWENNGKSGYSPIRECKCVPPCKGEDWKKCLTKKDVPWNDGLLKAHLLGLKFLGVYPLNGNKTLFCAIDFDGHYAVQTPQADIKRYLDICEGYEFPVFLERSQSGKGFHPWHFFSDWVPAWKPRTIAHFLLTEAQVIREEHTEEAAFDRIFPAQNEILSNGYGNLIALPLHGDRLKKGATAFIDPQTFEPYPDQWAIIQKIYDTSRITEKRLDEIISENGLKIIHGIDGKASHEKDSLPASIPIKTELSLSDQQIIEKAQSSKNGERFSQLWRGDYSGYKSHSEADLALCGMLAFWTQGDVEKIDHLFRRSGLYREKWDKYDYKDRTISEAISGKNNFYTGKNGYKAQSDQIEGPEAPPAEIPNVVGKGKKKVDLLERALKLRSADVEQEIAGSVLLKYAELGGIDSKEAISEVKKAYSREIGPDFDVQKIVIYQSIPPLYKLFIDDKTLEMSSANLLNIREFRRIFFETFRRAPQMPQKEYQWLQVVNGWMESVEVIEQPPEASEEGFLQDLILFNLRSVILEEDPSRMDRGMLYSFSETQAAFKLSPLLSMLNNHGQRVRPNKLAQIFREMGFDPWRGKIDGEVYRVWLVKKSLLNGKEASPDQCVEIKEESNFGDAG